MKHRIPPAPAARQHVWVTGSPPNDPGPHPGLIYQWLKAPDGEWVALVVFVVTTDDTLVQQWVSADKLTPVGRETYA